MATAALHLVGTPIQFAFRATTSAQCSLHSDCSVPILAPQRPTQFPHVHESLYNRRSSSPDPSHCSHLLKSFRNQNVQRRALLRVRAQVAEAETAEDASVSAKKAFLEDAKALGSIRIIVNTGMGVLESVTTLDKLFYHPMPGKGLYANVMNNEDNVDFHLLLDKVTKVNLVTAKSKRGDFQTYTVRFYDAESFNGASIFVMWKSGTMGEYAEGQVEAFESLLQKYGEEINF